MPQETTERFDIRLPASTKHMLTKAAEINGSTLTALVLGAAMDKAREILHVHQLFELNESDWQAFVQKLEHAPKANEALHEAWKDYHKAGLK